MRIFLSVELPEEIKNKIAELINELKKSEAKIKWISPKNLHITLKFLGWIDEGKLDNLMALTTKAVKGRGSFKANFKGLGTFPEGKHPRVIWVGTVEGGDRLCSLATVLEETLSGAGFRSEAKSFKPHITIGRVKSLGKLGTREMKGVDNFKEKIAQLSKTPFGEVPVDRIYIMKSTLTPNGPIYEKLKEVML